MNEGKGKKINAKNFKSCLFKPLVLHKDQNVPILQQYPPDPLHIVLLGPVNDVLSLIEKKFPQQMNSFYSFNKLSKKGQGIGGTFNGPSIKDILEESMLFQLEGFLPEGSGIYLNYLRILEKSTTFV